MLAYAIIETLNGNFVLKPIEKDDMIEIELHGDDLADIKKQYKEHVKVKSF